jgi:Cof subfamily protein (haloacid dehalogenase superfamily)
LRTLYITDLDGTLLNDNGQHPKKSFDILKNLLENGLPLSIATARSYNSAFQVIGPLDINMPILCHNGTFIYDPKSKKFINRFLLPDESLSSIIEIAVSYELTPFVYTLKNNAAHVYHAKPKNKASKLYLKDRLTAFDNRFIKDENYQKYKQEDCFFISILGTFNKMEHIYNILKSQDNIAVSLTQDAYHYNSWWVEIMPKKSGKGSALQYLRNLYKPEKIVCFGDNYNDITMFEEADYGVCVNNAVADLKNIANEIIGSCNDSSVAKYIERNFR